MDIQDIRRANLRTWVQTHGTPVKEKSYFSQILSATSPIGERAARRLERDYKMTEGFLDRPNGSEAPENGATIVKPSIHTLSWPIPSVSETQVHALSETQRHMLGDVIAQAIAQLALGIDISANTWPFSSLTPEQWSMLTERQRGRVEGYAWGFLQEQEALAVKSTAKAKAKAKAA